MTQNNSISMKTVVETYIIEETQELIYDNERLDKWNEHVSTLGLIGQTKIQAKDKSPIPFLHMKEPLVNVFTQLCPRHVNITEYDKTPIPVEILDLAALSVKESYFNKIEIWYDDKAPDPACVGLKGEYLIYNKSWNCIGRYNTREEMIEAKANNLEYHTDHFNIIGHYLIGRWADVKASLEQLTEKAKKLFIASGKSNIDQEIKKQQRKLEDLENDANIRFGFDDAVIPELPF